jgi:glucose-6-phosphate isomerase
MLIALLERAVGLYANLLGINAYHQPGVEAGEKAASETLKIRAAALPPWPNRRANGSRPSRFARKLHLWAGRNWCSKSLLHVSANPRAITRQDSPDPGLTLFRRS